ncbi:MAG TPA: DNA-processing protein DprA, partial [Rugosibacter sp.]|nr:DNA-processing protein DprA [Rugosibacter sp.]
MMPLSAADRLGLVAWLRFMQVEGIGSSGRRALLQAFGLPEAVFAASHAALTAVVGAQSAERLRRAVPVAGLDSLLTQSVPADVEHPDQAILAALAWAEQPGHHLLTLADANYPSSLLTTDDPPLILYVRGRVELLSQPMFAVVGSRNATAQGERDAEAFSAALGAAGLTVVSGLALGIDAAAHRGGLSSSAGTVAVVGTGVDRLYPARNADLAREIVNLGAIVSEFPLGTPALASNFPRRNRIIAGLGLGCLVVEAALRSGSLITARLAAEAGREVFAIPGSIHSPLTR